MIFPTTTAEWTRQKAIIEERIATHQRELEAAQTIDVVKFIQGQVAELRWLIGAAEPVATPGATPGKYS